MFENALTGDCEKCDSNCKTCDNKAKECTTCPPGKILHNKKCSSMCPKGYVVAGTDLV